MPVRNVVVVWFDDMFNFQRFRHTFGAAPITPNLDDFASRATVFNRAYATIAVCEPSRNACLTGLSPFQTMVLDLNRPEWEIAPPQLSWLYRLRMNGVFTTTLGKEWHGYVPIPGPVAKQLYDLNSVGISHSPGIERPYVENGGGYEGRGWTDPADDAAFYDGQVSRLGISRFNAAPWGDKPFYMSLGFKAPHGPFSAPQRFFDLYDWEDFIPPAQWANGFDSADFGKDMFDGFVYLPNSPTPIGGEHWAKTVRNYYARISHGDHEFGLWWEVFKASPRYADTAVIVISDHGWHLGDNWQTGKFSLWESACNAPLMVYHPDHAARTVNTPVSLIDLGETVMELSGLPPLKHGPGRSLLPHVRGEAAAPRWVPSFYYHSVSVTDGQVRLALYGNGDVEMHDVGADPHLTDNPGRAHPRFAEARDAALAACRDYGFAMVENGAVIDRTTPLVSMIGGVPEDADLRGSFASISPLGGGWKRSPNWRRQLHTLMGSTAQELVVPDDVDVLHVITGVTIPKVTIRAKGEGKDIWITNRTNQGTASREAEVHLDGASQVRTENHRLTVFGGRGNDTISGAQAGDWIVGGEGDDLIDGGSGNDTLDGGPGNDTIIGGDGNDIITAGAGMDSISASAGNDTITVTGGSHTIDLGSGNDTVILHRTERVQTIAGLASGGTLDLAAWAPIQPVRVTTVGSTVEVTAGLERIVCTGTTAAVVRAAIRGATIAP